MKGQTYIILAVVFAVIIAVFAVINVDPVEVNFLFGAGHAPLILVILFSVLMGAVITAAVSIFRIMHLQRELKVTKKELSNLTVSDANVYDVSSEEVNLAEIEEKNDTVK
ncbi:lipopolysaccharide assembly protein LapA domain-containing protein [Gracilibacillus sp. S3-1-1]|uniref:Lipopolysaccharide assembly protein LapA domain-containing protein n=1 Tax=Gracilibacillus pellucidus TaxID=3095368 RepID=A0ACC6M9L7_9BACI|nr:lipopolysaccharide assembly protein LapA domain-containing protein [Gracilibacillus sp. S3-1-1]MDX8047680.1 lipopolysaccharide assembly protein LapA domain-containing protein [Gracilibacillus sp. S3-1-1]